MAWKRILSSLLNSVFFYSMLKSHCCTDFLIIDIYIYIWTFRYLSQQYRVRHSQVTEQPISGSARAAHIKAFSLRYLKTESCGERPRVPFKTNPGTVNHRAFRPIPKHRFLKAGLPAVLLYCSMAWFGAFYYHGYCHKSRGQSERHGTRTNLNEPGSDFCVWEVYRQ